MKVTQSQATMVDTWAKAPGGLSVAGIKDSLVRYNTARLLENQKTKNLGAELLTEDFTQGVGAPLGLDQGIPHGGLHLMGSQRIRHYLATEHAHTSYSSIAFSSTGGWK